MQEIEPYLQQLSDLCYTKTMNKKLFNKLKTITKEEQDILDGLKDINRDLYVSPSALSNAPTLNNFEIDYKKLMEKGRQIEIRPHTRFAHFPKHNHNYVELIYMYHGSTTHIIGDTNKITLNTGDLLFLNQHASQEILPAGLNDIAVNFIILPSFFEQTLSTTTNSNSLSEFLMDTLTGKNTDISHIHFQAEDILPIQNLMENMIWNLVEKKKQTNLINQATMSLVFTNLSAFAVDNIIRTKTDNEKTLVINTLKYIDENYKSGTLSDLSLKENEPTD